MGIFVCSICYISSTGGREFIRAQTVPSIPIDAYLSKSEVQESYQSSDVPPPLPPRAKNRKSLDTQQRSQGQEWVQSFITSALRNYFYVIVGVCLHVCLLVSLLVCEQRNIKTY